ncbi:MAG TPA: DNA polymerase III subunit alpha [Armatimonadetes bacterium]|nr:DNA polymerase III subunit alpha [Armatimonadota bacterium]
MPAGKDFVHLHVHTEYSLLDGAARPRDLAAKAAAYGMPAVAMTDHGAMYGAVDFYQACVQVGVKPILGVEAYLAPQSRFDKHPGSRGNQELGHLTLLAENQTGYRNLLQIVSESWLNGFYYKPRLDRDLLREHPEGLIALSGCIYGEIPQAILRGKVKEAERLAHTYREIFGPDNFFLELMDHGMPEQKQVNPVLCELSRRTGIPLVVTNDVHYTEPADSEAQDLLLCIQTGSQRNDRNRLRMGSNQLFFRRPEEMWQILGNELPEALRRTREIAERCNVKLEFGDLILPDFEVPSGHTPDSYLRELCYQNLPRFYPRPTPEIHHRLDYELEVIQQKGYATYFLIVWDLVKFAKERGIRVGPGRGSAAGSLVSYVLGITELDPLCYDLFFERFLNPERPSAPDIDIDFPPERRDEVIDYAVRKYGQDRTAKVITFGTLGAKAAIRDVGRALGMPSEQVNEIAKLVPERPGTKLARALETVPELRRRYEESSQVRQLVDTALRLEGLARHTSVHAAALVISREPLVNYVPLAKMPSDGTIVTQFEWTKIEELGLLKMDFLALRTMTVIEETLKLVEETRGERLDLHTLPLDDRETYELISRGDVVGVFQLGESEGFPRVCKELRPDCIDDIIALVALYRPGPMEFIPHYISRKHGREKVTYLHPKLKPILKNTYGIILYQEQVMQIGRDLAGFTLGEADEIRKAVGKKDRATMEKVSRKFVEGCVKNGIPRRTAEELMRQVATFANYAFNKAHSACYALVAYWTAYLKAHYPVEFMAAQLTSVMDKRDKLINFIQDARRMGIRVRLPNVNRGGCNFSVDGEDILYGLGAIKGLGKAIAEAIAGERRQNGPFRDLHEFCERVDTTVVTKSALELLIRAGACADFGHRAQLLKVYESAYELGQQVQRDRESGQGSLFGGGAGEAGSLERIAPLLPNVPEVDKQTLLEWETDLLGCVLSEDPLGEVEAQLQKCGVKRVGSQELADLPHDSPVTIGGLVTSCRTILTRRNREMMFLTLTDAQGSVEVTVFNQAYKKYGHQVREGAVLLVQGTVDKQYEPLRRNGEIDDRPKVIGRVLVPPERANELQSRGRKQRPAVPAASAPTPAPEAEQDEGTEEMTTAPEELADPFAQPADLAPKPSAGRSPTSPTHAGGSKGEASVTGLHLRLRVTPQLEQQLQRLRELLQQHSGSVPVYLHLHTAQEQSTLALGEGTAVHYTPALREALQDLLGPEGVEVE